MIENPIIRGFHPDPSATKIGDDYYIATSTFEWWPGVEIWHSKDLKNWSFHSRPLNRLSQLNLTGVPDGGGVYAPDLSYDGKTVYLLYTNVRERGAFMQPDNYLVTTDDINGEWSEPLYLNSLGFDPSLFHDDDGRKYLLSLDNGCNKGKRFNGLWLQEYDHSQKKLVGKIKQIYKIDELVEGAHIYHKNGYYYLLKAQGGTGERHSCQLSRSRSLWGEYEDCPFILLHSRDNPDLPLRRGGHGDLIEVGEELYLVHLARRKDAPCCGRETCIQKVEPTPDGWLRLHGGGENPKVEVPQPKLEELTGETDDGYYDFTKGLLPDCFQSLRLPPQGVEFNESGLVMRCGDSLMSRFNQSLFARRISERDFTLETQLSFEPDSEKHMAGLVLMYDTRHWLYCFVSRRQRDLKRVVNIFICDNGSISYPLEDGIEISQGSPVTIGAKARENIVHFMADGEKIGGDYDLTILSDDHVFLGFTGAMAGICCQDLYTREKRAAFKYFKYENP